jgi:hypothetical protein
VSALALAAATPPPEQVPAVRLRRATPADAPAVHGLKQSLRFGRTDGPGGFLLGSSVDHYERLARAGLILVLEGRAGGLAGFAVTLPDHVLRATELWDRRHHIRWLAGAAPFPLSARIAYFDQLAGVPTPETRPLLPALALAALRDLVATHHQHLLATVVREPVHNTAALPLLRAAGARPVGQIDESYPGFGRLLSDLYHVDLAALAARGWHQCLLARRLHRTVEALAAARGGDSSLHTGARRPAPHVNPG